MHYNRILQGEQNVVTQPVTCKDLKILPSIIYIDFAFVKIMMIISFVAPHFFEYYWLLGKESSHWCNIIICLFLARLVRFFYFVYSATFCEASHTSAKCVTLCYQWNSFTQFKLFEKIVFLQNGTCTIIFICGIWKASRISNCFRLLREKQVVFLTSSFWCMRTFSFTLITSTYSANFFSRKENAKIPASQDSIAMSIHCNYGWYVGCYECRRMDK